MITDLRGMEIRVGDLVAYGSRSVNRGVISIGEVKAIEDTILVVKVSHSTKYGVVGSDFGTRLSRWSAPHSVKI